MIRAMIIVITPLVFAILGLVVGYFEGRDYSIYAFMGGLGGLFVGGIAQNFVVEPKIKEPQE